MTPARELIAYASTPCSKRTIAALQGAGWHALVSPARCVWYTHDLPYALDNGAWSAFQQQRPWDSQRFQRLLRQRGGDAEWVVVPDIVAGGMRSLALSLAWLPRILDAAPYALLAVQDGMQPPDVAPYLGSRVGIFVGGSTTWKLTTLPHWCGLGAQMSCRVHIGRVNSLRRLRACQLAGATSFDGTSVTRYAKNLPRLDHLRRQGMLLTMPPERSVDADAAVLDGRDHY